MDPFEQMPLLGAIGTPTAPGASLYEEPDPEIEAKKEALRRQIAADLLRDKLAAAGTNAERNAVDRMRSPVYGQPGLPGVDRNLVADAMDKQSMGDYLTLNPGMRRFLNNPQADEPRPSLEEDIARLKSGPYAQGTLPSGTRVNHTPDGGIALHGATNDDTFLKEEMRKEKAMDIADRQKARSKAEGMRKGNVQARINASYGIGGGMPSGGGGERPLGMTGMDIDRALQTYGPSVIPLIKAIQEGAATVAASQADASGRSGQSAQYLAAQSDRDKWTAEKQMQERQMKIEALRRRVAEETDPVRKKMWQDQLDQAELESAGITIPPPSPPPPPMFQPQHMGPDITQPPDYSGFRPF